MLCSVILYPLAAGWCQPDNRLAQVMAQTILLGCWQMNLVEYTLCFIFSGSGSCLMLKRYRAPHRGLWNAPGGKLLPGEAAEACCAREVTEETGLSVEPRAAGQIDCKDVLELVTHRLYVFQASHQQMPVRQSSEGVLRWLAVDQILAGRDMVHNIPLFLPLIINGHWFRGQFYYRGNYLEHYAISLAERGRGLPLQAI